MDIEAKVATLAQGQWQAAPTRFNKGWRYTIRGVGVAIHDDALTFEQKRAAIAGAIARATDFPSDPSVDLNNREMELWELWDELKDADDAHHLDLCLTVLYDWADENRVWIAPSS